MKPTFALDLSRNVIALLRRTPKGWLTIGEVAFDAPDMAETLGHFRKTALGLSPFGLACKVILPNDQILYTEIHAPGPSREDKRSQIAAALEGRTPYAVEDLVFDWSGKGGQLRVAVVARQTLEEAEGFAVTHGLNPVSFVAVPESGAFYGEAWFGPSSIADTVLAPGETVERDREAVTVLGPDPAAPAYTAPPAPAPEPALAEVLPAPEPPLPEARPTPEATQAKVDHPPPPPPFEPPSSPSKAPPPAPLDWEVETPAAVDDTKGAPQPMAAGAVAAFAFDPTEAKQTAPTDAPIAPPAAPVAAKPAEVSAAQSRRPADLDEAPFTDVADESADGAKKPDDAPAVIQARVLASEILEDDVPPKPSTAAMFAFSSRRKAEAAPARSAPSKGLNGRASGTGALAFGSAARAFPSGAPKRGAAPVTAPAIPGVRPQPKVKFGAGAQDQPASSSGAVVKPAVRPKPTFGAAQPRPARTGFIFMVMVALLLISLALVAAWASFFLTQAEDTSAVVEDPAAIAEVTVEDEMAADLQDPATLAAMSDTEAAVDMGQEAALADLATPAVDGTDSVSLADSAAAAPGPSAETDPAAEVAAVQEAASEPAPETAVATDIPASRPRVEDQDEIFLAAMDAPPPALDALALPSLAATADAAPAAPMPPPAFGTVYQFDAQGLLVPTADGIVSPEGIMLFAGPPPRVPPPRSPAAASAAEAAAAAVQDTAAAPEAAPPVNGTAPPAAAASLVTGGDAVATTASAGTEAETAPADPALAGFRPRPRPEALVPADDGANLEAEVATQVVTLRPLGRPGSVAATAAAVTSSSAATDLGAQGASLTAQAEVRAAEAAALEAANPSIIAISMRPATRPDDLSRAVEAAVAAALREPDPPAAEAVQIAAAPPDAKPEEIDEMNEPEVAAAAPAIPTRASVAKQATFNNAINLSKMNLIGTFGTPSRPYALIRQANGRYKKVTIGDRIDGGVIKAITPDEVRYQKGGRLLALKLPRA